MSADDPLQAFFDADPTPAIDRRFETEVMAKVAARRFLIEFGLRLLAGLAVATALLLAAPALLAALETHADSLSLVGGVIAVVGVLAFAGQFLTVRGVNLPRLIRF